MFEDPDLIIIELSSYLYVIIKVNTVWANCFPPLFSKMIFFLNVSPSNRGGRQWGYLSFSI